MFSQSNQSHSNRCAHIGYLINVACHFDQLFRYTWQFSLKIFIKNVIFIYWCKKTNFLHCECGVCVIILMGLLHVTIWFETHVSKLTLLMSSNLHFAIHRGPPSVFITFSPSNANSNQRKFENVGKLVR